MSKVRRQASFDFAQGRRATSGGQGVPSLSKHGRSDLPTEVPWSEMVLVGRVARVHGLRGDVIINPETDFPESRFDVGRVVYRSGGGERSQPLRVTTVRFHRGRPIIGFEGIESIEQAEPLVGLELRVPAAWLEALPAGSFYRHDLAGCRVETRSGEVVGQVDRVEGEAGASWLALATGSGEVLVPLAAAICVSIDIGRKVIVIEPPEGLLELNRTREQGAGIAGDGSGIERRTANRSSTGSRRRRR